VKPNLDLDQLFSFALDDFQLQAIKALDQDKSVVVCAPTGSGKTLIGEYAIYRALAQGRRVFYTTPLKALSNQKFRDFQERFSAGLYQGTVGLITGDVVINADASVVVMTTEIFRNMLYETTIGQVGTSVENVATVVLDECHYISDGKRGTVWEEAIVYCPPSIQLVALSATIGNAQEFTDWINKTRKAAQKNYNFTVENCELINSDHRPIPLEFYFSNKKGLFPLLNNKKTAINTRLKKKATPPNRGDRRNRWADYPSLPQIVNQLHDAKMLPAIYVIFSRKGCDQAVEQVRKMSLVTPQEEAQLQLILLNFLLENNADLQEKLLTFFANHPHCQEKLKNFFAQNDNSDRELAHFLYDFPQIKSDLFNFLDSNSQGVRNGHLEPLTKGIAAHHAGILPAWKELVERLFEAGLIKVVFATATLAAGINMPARTTVISALKKRSDDGHRMLTVAEFLQIAGRAGRRGLDKVGYVVTVDTPFEGAKEAAFLATKETEPLKSYFTPSYGMVLNLLQKHSITEAKELLERSFAEFLAQLRLIPEQETIRGLTMELAQLDIELAEIDEKHFKSYEKLNEILKEERRLLKVLQQQAEETKKKEIAPYLFEISLGQILHLKGKHLRVAEPIKAVLINKIQGSGKAPDLLCLGEDGYWYLMAHGDVVYINEEKLEEREFKDLILPDLQTMKLGKGKKIDQEFKNICEIIKAKGVEIYPAPEIIEQQTRITIVQEKIKNHPLTKWKNTAQLMKRHKHRLELKKQFDRSQRLLQQHKAHGSYYWQDFLNLIKVLRDFEALEDYSPTPLGEASATIRGENELWLGLILVSNYLDDLAPCHLAGAISAFITEPSRPDMWTNYQVSSEVWEVVQPLQKIRKKLIKTQVTHEVEVLVLLELELVGLVEEWASGVDWLELCQNTSLDEGDIVRILRRTVDVLWQIPQVPRISPTLAENAKQAIKLLKRFPI
jgi:superfamily II RNA helicase